MRYAGGAEYAGWWVEGRRGEPAAAPQPEAATPSPAAVD
jgi:hypothetical protein